MGNDTETKLEWLSGAWGVQQYGGGNPYNGHPESLAEWAPGIQVGDSAWVPEQQLKSETGGDRVPEKMEVCTEAWD